MSRFCFKFLDKLTVYMYLYVLFVCMICIFVFLNCISEFNQYLFSGRFHVRDHKVRFALRVQQSEAARQMGRTQDNQVIISISIYLKCKISTFPPPPCSPPSPPPNPLPHKSCKQGSVNHDRPQLPAWTNSKPYNFNSGFYNCLSWQWNYVRYGFVIYPQYFAKESIGL